jgi:CBS domain-containing protein
VYDAIHLMAEKEIGALMVTKDGNLAGVISERDYARKINLEGKSSETTMVEEIMTAQVVQAESSDSIEECMGLMTEHRIRHLPVVDGGKLVGVISIGDLVRYIIADQRFVIEQMERYISG